MKGPFPILARGHSGSRLLSEAFLQNQVWMGRVSSHTKDTKAFDGNHAKVQALLRDAFHYAQMSTPAQEAVQQRLQKIVQKIERQCLDPQAWVAYGWKRGLTVFMVEIILDAYPQAKVVHLIRDGRDVMLSRLDGRMRRIHNPVTQLTIFGKSGMTTYRGKPLTPEVVEEYRDELEMHHWVTAVRFGMRGRRYGKRYKEVRYEDLCTHPIDTLGAVFDFLDLPFTCKAREWITANASTQRIGKWRDRAQALQTSISIGEPLLREFGYMP